MNERRVDRVLHVLKKMDVDAIIIRGMDNIFYLTGFRGSEGSLLVTKGDIVLLTDFRYLTYAAEVTKDIAIVETRGKENHLAALCERYGISRMGFDSYNTTYQAYQAWCETVPNVEFVAIGTEIEVIRKQKEPEEILAIRRAIQLATDAFTHVLAKIAPGATEKQIAAELDYIMKSLGADGPSFETIVASGARAALPHAKPTNKALKQGETVIIDFGCQAGGYTSDETCTIVLGEVDQKLRDVFDVVDEARKTGIKAVRAGLPVVDLDTLVRGVVEEHGYGEFFRHGTGHGVGIAVHEAPAITVKAEALLEENMVITIEPGIYIPELGGIRMEDMVLVTDNGGEVLTHLRKDLLQI
ncbi:MAG TPA: Xaa-Pro peptidase family protein [Syntrophorhabdales bacterium]|nr:Xaa-Pro peptidase family protein [Syntrophorhabdales bacterium]